MKRNDDAQVGVIVAILLAALIAIVLIIIQVEYVPSWMNDKEAENMDLVQNQIALLKSNIDRQSTDRSITYPLTNPLKLGTERLPYFVSSRSYGTFDILSSDNSNFYIDITSPDANIEQKFDDEFSSNQLIKNITQINYFELLIQNVSPPTTEYFIISTIFEGEETGNMTLKVENGTITITTVMVSGIIFNQPIATGLSDFNYRINLMNPDYKLYKIIGTSIYNLTSQTPYHMNLSFNGTATFSLTGKKFDNTIFPHIYPLGTMTYQSESSYFSDYAFIYESGGIIVNQSGGHAMVFPPSLTIINSTISFLFIDIEPFDEHDTISGFGTYSIKTIFTSSTNIRFRGTKLNFTINSEHPNAWFKYLNSTYNLSTGYLNTTISHTSDSATLKAEANIDKVEIIITSVKIFSQIEYT